jgi:uncharacterized cupredoxin-like copper-binding protein
VNGAARLLFLLPAIAGLIAAGCGGAGDETATIGFHYSHFTPETVRARAGEPITITLRNDDPLEHEWIVGPPDVHERHRTGTEPYHDAIPTEVTVPALSTRTTRVIFWEPGEYLYICHLPGHEAYGMVGTLVVEP